MRTTVYRAEESKKYKTLMPKEVGDSLCLEYETRRIEGNPAFDDVGISMMSHIFNNEMVILCPKQPLSLGKHLPFISVVKTKKGFILFFSNRIDNVGVTSMVPFSGIKRIEYPGGKSIVFCSKDANWVRHYESIVSIPSLERILLLEEWGKNTKSVMHVHPLPIPDELRNLLLLERRGGMFLTGQRIWVDSVHKADQFYLRDILVESRDVSNVYSLTMEKDCYEDDDVWIEFPLDCIKYWCPANEEIAMSFDVDRGCKIRLISNDGEFSPGLKTIVSFDTTPGLINGIEFFS